MSEVRLDGLLLEQRELEHIGPVQTCCTTCMNLSNRVRPATYVVRDERGMAWFECERCLHDPERERAGGNKPVEYQRISMFRLRIARDERDKNRTFLNECDSAIDLALREASEAQ